jgi:hypothetical protein
MKWWAAPVLGLLLTPSPASALPCAPGTFQAYLDLGAAGCSVGAVQFQNFTSEPGQSFATPIDPALVQVAPGGTLLEPTLVLSYQATAGAGELLESFFRFQVSATGLVVGGLPMADALATGDGAVTAAADVCPGGSFGAIPTECPGDPATVILYAIASESLLDDAAALPATDFADLFVDVVVDGGPEGSASLGAVTIALTLVPEPASAVLLALGLVPLGIRRGRRAHAR